jgi:phosphoglycerate dehydrogenase-like enzyme
MNIILMSRVDPEALEVLRRQHDVVCAFDASDEERLLLVADREVLVFRSGVRITSELIAAAPRLELILRAGSGYDNLDIDAARKAGIRVVRIPGPSARAVAEFALALVLCLSRNVALADRLVRQGRWPKAELAGPALLGKALGLVGLGSIGTQLAELGQAVGMRVLACVRHPEARDAAALQTQGIQLATFEHVLSEADYLVVLTPLDESTHHLIDARALSRMKPGSYLINVARGGVVDEKALLDALRAGSRLRGAALDVHEREGEGAISGLTKLDNVILTPHIGGSSLEAQNEIGVRLIELLGAFRAGSLNTEAQPGELVI